MPVGSPEEEAAAAEEAAAEAAAAEEAAEAAAAVPAPLNPPRSSLCLDWPSHPLRYGVNGAFEKNKLGPPCWNPKRYSERASASMISRS